ncbi:hypothetical protein BU24DRAFT_419634 [Aaosphaeria arxii CBS 175.79]|uniref:DH domain-containing protein n=1 Tax=Aaosphaeria arxii CBS 175.79 TaxID=1450172 RepID=A0A6A5Y4T6_9PLEO|nr:uncharacterized protein BU24DRAFT_419634 [Aaosphaeria arxii CBS 175.79]KAF2020047.1 hypothetical protein BU24DRAFT_419634 [Aaosphaeria arxii CBS 175.79]
MVLINPEPAALSPGDLSLFYTTDEFLSNSPVLIFYGPTSTSTHATHSRIQAHIFTPAGLQNFARLIISPTAPFYSAVTCLPREEQGDEICRGLAFSLFKYFVELPEPIKDVWEKQYGTMARLPSAPTLFSEAHAAMVAARMVKVENVGDIIVDVRHALGEQTLSWLDVDIVLPQGTMQKLEIRESAQFDEAEDDILQQRYGAYAPVIKLFGEAAFLPTSKLRRAPSKPTALNRSQSFSRKNKENLRREMCELLDTEENYVSKIDDLIHNVAVDFRQKAKARNPSSTSPTEQALQGLFPPSLDKILEVNHGFLEAIRNVLEETENDAIQDIENANDDIFVAPLRGQKDPPDVTGALAVGKALLEWFPQFEDCYTDYISAHGDFSQFLKVFMKDTGSSFSKRIHETGEQRLTSLLIEPVQRLPRYNLYIDNIVKQLPVRHPAIKVFLKARDIISEICSRDGPSAQQIKVFDRLRKMVFSWPPSFHPPGRLITAIDFVELSPPYHGDLSGPGTTSGIMLLFTSHLVLLHKPNGSTVTARSVMSDLDTPKFGESISSSAELIFHQQLKLCDVSLSEHSDGNILQLISPTPTSSQPGRPRSRDRQNIGIRMLCLQGPYEGKVHRCVEEIVKARVEGRYPEDERESYKWEVRSAPGDLNLFSAVSEDLAGNTVEGRREPAKVQILVEPSKMPEPLQVHDNGIEMTISISVLQDGLFLIETRGANDYNARDKLTSVEFQPVITKRLANYFQLRNNIRNPSLSEAYLFKNSQILKALRLEIEDMDERQDSKSRPHSPVKMLSSLFGASVGRDGGSRRLQRNPPSLGDISRMAPPLQPAPTRTHSRDGELSRPTSSSKSVSFNAAATPTDSLSKLEETMATLLLAIHARKGNIVGRSVRARVIADELLVNEVYNSLLENPSNIDTAAHSSVDVLFAAFEKFLKIAWREKMGPVVSLPTLVSLQHKSDSMYPGEFEEFFRTTLNEMAPQNQRSIRAIIKLLADLLDGTSNDGDRGILTAAFAEMLVPDGDAAGFISLIDRLIQDNDALFAPQTSGVNTPNFGSVDSKTRSAAAGSINSNTSLRKRFGLSTLTRENSKSESTSKVGSLWRSLSKNDHGMDNQPSSISKAGPASLGRSNSTDMNLRLSPKRPSSRDRPTVLGAFPFEGQPSPHGRSFLGTLGVIGEVPSNGPPRKKRRSSLSDLKTLQTADHTPTWSPQTPRRADSSQVNARQSSASPHTPSRNTPSPVKHSSIPTPTSRLGSPMLRLGSPIRKENSPAVALDRPTVRPKSVTSPEKMVKPDEVTIKSYSPTKKRTESVTGIPILKPTGSGLSERPTSGNTVKIPPSTPRSPTKAGASASPPKRLKMQSPQKLRERLQTQQRDVETASKDLQSELSAIGHELSARSVPRLTTQTSAPPSASASGSNRSLESRIANLEKHLKTTLDALQLRSTTISNDVTSSLQVSEARAKHLDQLYRDMNAENEALYARFNEELEKVERAVRKGKGNEEVDRRMKASEEEAARLRKENARLKREVAGLKAQLRE